jgi:hypothetical protein
MSSAPSNASLEGPRKRKIPLDDNGEPVQLSKKKELGPRPPKKTKMAPKTATASKKCGPARTPAAGPSRTRARSASVEEVPEEVLCSVTPHNPRNILEAADRSDAEPLVPENHPPPSESAMDVDGESEAEEEPMEEPEESDEAELSVSSLPTYTISNVLMCY